MSPELARARAIDRIERRLDKSGDCWIWTGPRREGYGKQSYRVGDRIKSVDAHRAMYEKYVGQLEEGRQVHHLCGIKLCANPQHLESLEPEENASLGRPCPDPTCTCVCHEV